MLADNCETYNAALQERKEAWKLQRKSITYRDQQAELTELRKDPAFQWMACDIMRDPLRRVDRAFKAFFRRCKAGEKPGFPRYRSRFRYDSFTFSLPVCRERSIKIPNVGDIRARGGRPTTGNGIEIQNPRWTRKHEARIAAANRSLATKQRRSKNRLRAKELLRRAHQRVANVRLNHIHHVSKWLVENYDLIAHEDLKIRNMGRSNLAKSIHDAAWGLLIHCITYKAESAGRWVVPVNPNGTSQRCSGCGATVRKKLSERVHSCACGLTLGRDANASRNVLALGMSAVEVQAKSIQQITLDDYVG